MSQLNEKDLREWSNSAVDPELTKLNVISLKGNTPYEYLLYGLDRQDRRNDGRISDKWLKRYSHLVYGGWWCQTLNVSNWSTSDWGCFKPYNPRKDFYKHKIIKYEHPPKVPTEAFILKVPPHIELKIAEKWNVKPDEKMCFWQWLKSNDQLPLIVTEGAKKAGALLSLGYPAIALPGINNTHGADGESLIPELQAFATRWREITIAFDSDSKWKTVQVVNKAISKLGNTLTDLDIKVSVALWDSDHGKGIDDVIAKHEGEFWEQIYDRRITLEKFEEKRQKKIPRYDLQQLLDFFGLEFKHRLSFDNLREQILLDGKLLDLQNNYRAWLCTEYGIDANKENLLEALTFQARKNSFNPIENYLRKVVSSKDRVSIDNLATRYFGTTEPIYDVFLKKWLIGAVARVLDPGCKNDCALILQGIQGIGKSSFFQTLGGEGFDDSMSDLGSKDSLLVMHRCWIQELSEFDKISSKKAAGEIKAFLTRTTDVFRKPYGEKAESYPRRSVFCGSVNKNSFLLDETGNRRFWVIPISIKILAISLSLLSKERDGIWATAVEAYKSGAMWWLTPQENKLAMANNEKFEVTDVWETEVADYLDDKTEISIKRILREKFDLLPVEQDKKNQMRVTNILVKLGWSKLGRKTINGKREYVWHLPLQDEIKKKNSIFKSFIEGGAGLSSAPKQYICPPPPEKVGQSLQASQNGKLSDSNGQIGSPWITSQETFEKSKNLCSDSTSILIGSNVLYQGEIYQVIAATHSHLQLKGMKKAVPIWECERKTS